MVFHCSQEKFTIKENPWIIFRETINVFKKSNVTAAKLKFPLQRFVPPLDKGLQAKEIQK